MSRDFQLRKEARLRARLRALCEARESARTATLEQVSQIVRELIEADITECEVELAQYNDMRRMLDTMYDELGTTL